MKFERGKDPKESMGIGSQTLANRIFEEMNKKAPFWNRIKAWDWAIQTWKYDSGIPNFNKTASLVFTREVLKAMAEVEIVYEFSKETHYPEYRIVSNENGCKSMLVTIEYWLNNANF